MPPEKGPKPDKDLQEAVRKNLAAMRSKLASSGKPKLPPNWAEKLTFVAKPETPEVKEAREARRRREADQIALDLIKEQEPGLLEKIKQAAKAVVEFLDKNPQAFLNDQFTFERENITFDELKQYLTKALESKSAELGIPKEAIAVIIFGMVIDMPSSAKSFEKVRHLKDLGTFKKVSLNYDHGNIDFYIVDNQGNQETILKGPFITVGKIDKIKKDLQAFLEILS